MRYFLKELNQPIIRGHKQANGDNNSPLLLTNKNSYC